MKRLVVVYFVAFFCLGFVAAAPTYSHSESQVLIFFDSGYSSNLQEASELDFLFPDSPGPSVDYSSVFLDNFGHDADQIWVSVDGVESSLKDALDGDGICGSFSVPYSGSISFGHFASDIDFSGYDNFQDAIDSGAFCENVFVSVWKTKFPLGAIDLPLESDGSYNFFVDWGDGKSDVITSNLGGFHMYSVPGLHEVRITGEIKGFNFAGDEDGTKLIEIKNWGPLNVGNNGGYFKGCRNFDISAKDSLDLTGTTNLKEMFSDADSLSGGLSNWDMSEVVNMHRMFSGADNFNGDLSSWDVSSVVSMEDMFYNAVSFNGDLSDWDVSSVVNMHHMFRDAENFNGDLSDWNVSSVVDMGAMLHGLNSFNYDLSSWDVDQVEECSLFSRDSPAWVLPKPNFTNCDADYL